MDAIIAVCFNIVFVVGGTFFFYRDIIRSAWSELKKQTEVTNNIKKEYINRRGAKRDSYGRPLVKPGSKEWFEHPTVQRQLSGMRDIFRMETIRAIHKGKTPPSQVGKGRYSRESLRDEWDDEWEAIAREMGIKLFEKKAVLGTPGYRWVDVRPENTLTLQDQTVKNEGLFDAMNK